MANTPNRCWFCSGKDSLVPRGGILICKMCRATTGPSVKTQPPAIEPVHNLCAGLGGAPKTINAPTAHALRQIANARAAAREKSLDNRE